MQSQRFSRQRLATVSAATIAPFDIWHRRLFARDGIFGGRNCPSEKSMYDSRKMNRKLLFALGVNSNNILYVVCFHADARARANYRLVPSLVPLVGEGATRRVPWQPRRRVHEPRTKAASAASLVHNGLEDRNRRDPTSKSGPPVASFPRRDLS